MAADLPGTFGQANARSFVNRRLIGEQVTAPDPNRRNVRLSQHDNASFIEAYVHIYQTPPCIPVLA